MRKEQLDVLFQVCEKKNITLKKAMENIPELIKEFPALEIIFGGVK